MEGVSSVKASQKSKVLLLIIKLHLIIFIQRRLERPSLEREQMYSCSSVSDNN